jgi:hypothetical protein
VQSVLQLFMKNLLKKTFRPDTLGPKAGSIKTRFLMLLLLKIISFTSFFKLFFLFFLKMYQKTLAKISIIRYNLKVFWILNTAGITKKDAPSLIFLTILFLTSPWLYFIIIVRLVIILVIIHMCVHFVDRFLCMVSTIDISDRKTMRAFFIFFIAVAIIVIFKLQQNTILSQGEKQSSLLLKSALKLIHPFLISIEEKPLSFSPFHYTEHTYHSRVLETIHAYVGASSKRHDQSTFMNLFLTNPCSYYNKEHGNYFHINPHSVLGNSQPGNDFMGKYTTADKNIIVIAEAKSTGFSELSEKQLGALAPEVQLYRFKQLVHQLLQANIGEMLANGNAKPNQHMSLLLNQEFVKDYCTLLSKGFVIKDGTVMKISAEDFESEAKQTLIFLSEFRNSVISHDKNYPLQIKVNAAVSAWEFNKASIIKQLNEAKFTGVNRLDVVFFTKSK